MRLFSVIDFTFDWWDSFSCFFVSFVLRTFLIERFWIVFSDCLIWLIVPIGCFLLNDCDFVRKKKNYGRTVYCNVAVVKPYVKMSVVWFKRLIFWFWWVSFVVKTLLCSERRFASDECKIVWQIATDTVLALKKTQRVVQSCFNCVDFMAQTAA